METLFNISISSIAPRYSLILNLISVQINSDKKIMKIIKCVLHKYFFRQLYNRSSKTKYSII